MNDNLVTISSLVTAFTISYQYPKHPDFQGLLPDSQDLFLTNGRQFQRQSSLQEHLLLYEYDRCKKKTNH